MKTEDKAKKEEAVPVVISVRTKDHLTHLRRWRRGRRGVPWGVLLREALDKYFLELVDEQPEATAEAARHDMMLDMHTKRNLRAGVEKLRAQARGRNKEVTA